MVGTAMTLRAALPADAAAIARVHVASWRTTYPGMLPDGYLAGLDVEEYAARWSRTLEDPYGRSEVLVAEEAGGIVGFASCGRERDGDPRYDGELYAIYLLSEAQGRGHGRALIQASAAALFERGWTSMVVWVLRDNARARLFYERMGGDYLREREIDFGFGVSVMEVAYLWPDTRPQLLTRAGVPAGRPRWPRR
jgi:ribosomal protein S18 acetylase RimI-like enzyme